MVAVGDGALGFWAALRDVFRGTKEQRCWVFTSPLRTQIRVSPVLLR